VLKLLEVTKQHQNQGYTLNLCIKKSHSYKNNRCWKIPLGEKKTGFPKKYLKLGKFANRVLTL
jgi:hypothetical protein